MSTEDFVLVNNQLPAQEEQPQIQENTTSSTEVKDHSENQTPEDVKTSSQKMNTEVNQVDEPLLSEKLQNDSQSQNNSKINFLYFLGLNSLTLNLLSSLKLFYTLYSCPVLVLVNLIAYLWLYKSKEVKQFYLKSQEKTLSVSQKIQKEATRERVLIGLLAIFITSLALVNIYNTIQVNKLENEIWNKQNIQNVLNHQIHNQRLELLHKQDNDQRHTRQQIELNNMNKQISKYNELLYQQIQQLNQQYQIQQNTVNQLKQELNNLTGKPQNETQNTVQQKQQKQEQPSIFDLMNDLLNIQTTQQNQSSSNNKKSEQTNQQSNKQMNMDSQTSQKQQYQKNPELLQKTNQSNQQQQPQQKIKYIKPYFMAQKQQQQQTQQQAQGKPQTNQNQQRQQQQTQQNGNQQGHTYKDSRLNFLNESFKQLNAILQSN